MGDPEFGLLPVAESITPEEDLDAAAASALADPYGIPESEDPPLPFGRSWAFDHDHGRFFRSAGAPVEVRGEAALAEYIQAAMRTAAGVHPSLPPEFGVERPEDFLGAVDPTEALSDFEVRLREALTAHDRIENVQELEADVDLSSGIITLANLVIVTDQEEAIPLGPFSGIRPES